MYDGHDIFTIVIILYYACNTLYCGHNTCTITIMNVLWPLVSTCITTAMVHVGTPAENTLRSSLALGILEKLM